MRIEICGGIAAGKTTLAKSLEVLGYACIYEDFSLIAPLDDFYADPERYNFETEFFFLLQHMYQLKKQYQTSGCVICDYSFEQDYAYAKQNIVGNAWKGFKLVFDEVLTQIREASLIINLQCAPEILQERIIARGRINEKMVSIDYLKNTVNQVNNRLNEIFVRVVHLDSGVYDFRDIEVVKKVVVPIISTYFDS